MAQLWNNRWNSAETKAERLKVLWPLANNGGTLSEACEALKLSKPGLLMWLKHNKLFNLHRKLKENGIHRVPAFSEDQARERLLIVQDCRAAGFSWRMTARVVGISWSALGGWLRRNAPWGVDDALKDYSEDEENGLH